MNTEMNEGKLKVVFDTNIFISALNFGGTPSEVIFLAQTGIVELYISTPILYEIHGVLIQKFNWHRDKAEEAIELLQRFARLVSPLERVTRIQDDSDNRVLECALAADANLIVSGDQHLLDIRTFQGIAIVTAKQFLSHVRR